ncbi:ComEA family DNA-binding protein [Methylobacterium iners]|uniref:Helix-hairpin-helix domain-containing protein n=1 Tax=Methylobacterium iners TaxID=418707 RepID=A0ABQ4RVM8_9HYPH|nr:helix-hairpin-helix domain-containing protein [Methylobacterium iners]GJD93585.1 hypothetical protein OCOJLMKI_0781 [Methylobacterium iners]
MSKLAVPWAMPISGLLGLGAVALLAAAAPKLGNAAGQGPAAGQAVRTPLAAPVVRSATSAVSPALVPSPTAAVPQVSGAPTALSLSGQLSTVNHGLAAIPSSDIAAASGVASASGLRLDLSTAGISELRKLPQITRGRAYAIVRGRPYNSVSDLIERKVISRHAYLAIRDKVELR